MISKSAISLISYDASYLPESICKYYNYVDEIILGLDIDRISWNKNSFSFDEEALWEALKEIDVDNKIEVVEDNFHKLDKAIDNDNAQRNALKEHCSTDWIVSIDADEYLLNAKDFFVNYCPLVEPYYKTKDILLTWATPYKTIDDTTLVIVNEDYSPFLSETQGFMTSKDSTYNYARWTEKSGSGNLMSPLVALHYSLCRNEKELHTKINNTGHADIADTDPFFSIWQQVTLDNYKELHNFKTSGLGQAQWPRLLAVKTEQLESFITQSIPGIY